VLYSMCYLFCRCTRSISVVPPVAYAHLAAKRARCLMDEILEQEGGAQLQVTPWSTHMQCIHGGRTGTSSGWL
jgi:hypothetical protein